MADGELRAKILAADDLPKKSVHVSEWGVDVFVTTLTGQQRDKLESEWLKRRRHMGRDDKDLTDFRAFVACWCMVDEAGKRIFDPANDVNGLTRKSGAALTKVWNVAAELNRFTDSDVEELVGNSEAGGSAGSISDSP